MAGILRALLHDRLIDHLTPLDELQFADTASRLPDNATAGYGFGITRILIAAHGDGFCGRIIASLGAAYEEAPPPTTPFAAWWSQDEAVYPTNLSFLTREYVVYEMANTDAIHIDTELDVDYEALTRDNHGFTLNGMPETVTGDLASAAIRQIVWETQYTLNHALPEVCGADFPGSRPEPLGGILFRVAAIDDGSSIDTVPANQIQFDEQLIRRIRQASNSTVRADDKQ